MKIIILFLLSVFSLEVCSQYYSSNFTSDEQILNYLKENISKLNPIEGLYDVQTAIRTNSPYARDIECSTNWYIVKDPHSENYTIYAAGEDGLKKADNSYASIAQIGDTQSYRLSWMNSSKRAFLENNIRLHTKIHLNQEDARKTFNNPYYAYDVYMDFDFIKKYPTQSMYAEANRKKEEERIAKIVEETVPSEWSGTGFALKGNYIATNYHVVENATTITIQGVNGDFNKKYDVTVVASDKFNDIAILKVNGINIPANNIPYSVKTSTSEVGEDVFVLGYPLTSTMGEEIKLTTGVISSKTGFQGDVSLYQISAPIQPGNSGGPLFDEKGNVVGIISAKHKGTENVSYAIKSSYLKNLMESAMSTNILPQANKIASYKLSDKVKSLKNYVYYITCSSSSNNSSLKNSNNTGGSVSSATEKTYNNPYINRNMSNSLKVLSVKIQDNQTVITFSDNNKTEGGYYQWFTMDKNAYIVANGQRYTLTRTEGIAISPDKTYFSYVGETKTFTLYFPPIPKNTTSIDFIETEDSDWRLYGIQLR